MSVFLRYSLRLSGLCAGSALVSGVRGLIQRIFFVVKGASWERVV